MSKIFHKPAKDKIKAKHKDKKFKDLSEADILEITERIFIANGYCVK